MSEQKTSRGGRRIRLRCGSGRFGWCSTTSMSTRRSGRRSSRSRRSSASITRRCAIWVRRAEADAGARPGLTTDERAKIKELEREVKELRRANEILKAAAAFFGAELDRQSQK